MNIAEIILLCLGALSLLSVIIHNTRVIHWFYSDDFQNVIGVIVTVVPLIYSTIYVIWYLIHSNIHISITFGG